MVGSESTVVTLGDVLARYEAALSGLEPNGPLWAKAMETVHDMRLAYRLGTRDVQGGASGLAKVGATFVEFFDTTNDDGLGHDHLCPSSGCTDCDETPCSCGWSDLLEAYEAATAGAEHKMAAVYANEQTNEA